jgi:sugar phosphate isomerase/epimerase
MHTISFVTANYVARQVNYSMSGGWGQGDQATNQYFRPLETFAQRFEEIVTDIKALGFDALDLWTAHLHQTWATDQHIRIARDILHTHQIKVVSLAGGFGATPREFEAACNIAVEVGAKLLGGMTPLVFINRAFVVATLNKYDLRLGIENHSEKTPDEMLAKIGDGSGGRIGTTVDTGWYGTHGYDAAQAIAQLGEHVLHVHLKDVLAAGAHNSCRYGQGSVPIEACVRTLLKIGYRGAFAVEHEPDYGDPTADCKAAFDLLRGWLAAP